MDVTIPVYNELIKGPGSTELLHRVFPLFSPAIIANDVSLQRATNRMLVRLQKTLNLAGRSASHEALTRLIFDPELTFSRQKLALSLKHRIAKTTLLFVVFPLLDRYVAFAPRLPELWFELEHPEKLEVRAKQVYEQHFRALERQEDFSVTPESISNPRDAWISWCRVNVRTDLLNKEEVAANLLSLFGGGLLDGADELSQVGHCLDHLYPDDLDRTLFREQELQDAEAKLNDRQRRPILLVGPNSVGKTCLVHELVYRHVAAQQKRARKAKANFWWLSPQRLISGMMYVGQWENRLLAILEEAKKQNHVLYFDDLLSMFRAGQSRGSRLCVANLIKNALRNHTVRFIAEITPEAYQVFASRDRGFADMFHVIHVHPTNQEQTLRIAVTALQNLELKYKTIFHHNVLATMQQFMHLNSRSEAMPGRLVRNLKALAIRNQRQKVVSRDVVEYFQISSGLSRTLLDRSLPLDHQQVAAELKALVVGQRRALDSVAQIVSIARANLNEPNRPLGSLLFLGPTGVGKTETAKAAATVMFNSSEHLIRFDLNQFKTAYAASTLVGTLAEPEGLLTSAVRQRPHCVLLLDEIEKAHPDVHEILLQVLGEARLTDSLGRTTDFSHCLIILTSNLGTQRSAAGIGFNSRDLQRRYIEAARQFFRPEFFNRIDEIIPFTSLKQREIRKIAQRLIGNIVARQGLVRRQCTLVIEPEAIDVAVELGYHPELGARAMKRALEDALTSPVAERLATLPFDSTTIVRVFRAPAHEPSDRLQVNVQRVDRVAVTRPKVVATSATQVIEQTQKFLARVARPPRPNQGITAGHLTDEMLRYFSLDEQTHRVKALLDKMEAVIAETKIPSKPENVSKTTRKGMKSDPDARDFHRQASLRKDVLDFFEPSSPGARTLEEQSAQLINDCCLLQAMLDAGEQSRAWLLVQPLQRLGVNPTLVDEYNTLQANLLELFRAFGYQVDHFYQDTTGNPPATLSCVSGPCLQSILPFVDGIYECNLPTGQIVLYQVVQVPESSLQAAQSSPLGSVNAARQFAKAVDLSTSTNAWSIVQTINSNYVCTDLRSGKSFKFAKCAPQWYQAILQGLPLPVEFIETQNG